MLHTGSDRRMDLMRFHADVREEHTSQLLVLIRHTFQRLKLENEMRQGNSALGLTDRAKVFGWIEGRFSDVLLRIHFSTRCMFGKGGCWWLVPH